LELDVWVQPRASRDAIAGVQAGALKVRITAPPVEGEANDALVRFLAKLLGIPKKNVEILRGETGRRKTLLLKGVSTEAARKPLGL
jgi:uncharacterized protein (TIGR00251 family)